MRPAITTPYERATFERAYHHLAALAPVSSVRTPKPLEDGRLTLAVGARRLEYHFDVKRTIFPKTLPHVLTQLQSRPRRRGTRRLLITDYLTDHALDLLRASDSVDYVDAAGNMLLRWPGFYVELRGRRRVAVPGRARPLATAGGMRVLFALLAQRSLHDVVYRDLEAVSGVTLGTISRTIKELRSQGLIEQRQGTLTRSQPTALLDLWVTGYAQWLRPQLVLGHYRSPRPLEGVVNDVRATLDDQAWGLTGGFAAELLTKHYRGDTLGLFVRTWDPRIVQKWRWLPDDQGPITVFRPFSHWLLSERSWVGGVPVLHALLVYAELIFDGRERPRAAAERVRERHLSYLE